MRKLIIIFVSVLISVLFIGFRSSAISAAPKVVMFGYNSPLSGPAAPWGVTIGRSIEASINVINESGGFTVGGEKYVWKIISADHGYVPSTAVTNTRKMIQDGIKYMGTLGGSCAAAMAPISEAAGVLSLNMAGAGSALTKPEYKFTFRYNWDLPIIWGGFYK